MQVVGHVSTKFVWACNTFWIWVSSRTCECECLNGIGDCSSRVLVGHANNDDDECVGRF